MKKLNWFYLIATLGWCVILADVFDGEIAFIHIPGVVLACLVILAFIGQHIIKKDGDNE